MTKILAGLGIRKVFDSVHQRFINEDLELVLDFKQKATLKIDERSSEAAAVTGGLILGSASDPREVNMTVGRPFFFYITEASTGTLLFVARITDT